MQLIIYGGFYFGRIQKNMGEYREKAVFWVAMTGLGKYHMGSYSRIGV